MDWKLEVVVVPVSDVDRSRQFYAEQIGFAVDLDTTTETGIRVVQLTPPGSGCSVHIGSGAGDAGGMAPGSLRGLQLVVTDLDAARAHLLDRGIDVSPIRHVDKDGWADGRGGRWNSFVFFDDPDGNGWVVQERPAGEDG
jgi:catechol 2,3-dioxygenase-like lactoylglutathione lyase family enzyme